MLRYRHDLKKKEIETQGEFCEATEINPHTLHEAIQMVREFRRPYAVDDEDESARPLVDHEVEMDISLRTLTQASARLTEMWAQTRGGENAVYILSVIKYMQRLNEVSNESQRRFAEDMEIKAVSLRKTITLLLDRWKHETPAATETYPRRAYNTDLDK